MRVPVAQNQVTARGLPSARIDFRPSAADYGADIGQALQGVGAVTQDIYQQEKRKAHQIAVEDASNQLGAWESNTMPVALQVRGKDAFGLPDKVLPDYDKTASKIEEGLTDPDAKEAFRLLAADRRNGVNRALQSHMGAERHTYDDQVFQDGLATSQQAVGLYYQDEGRVNQELDRQANAVQDYGQRNGMPPEWVAATKAKTISQSHSSVIDRMLADENDTGAKAHFDRYQAEMTPDAQAQTIRALDVAGTRGESQRQAAAIFSTEKPLDTMLDEVRKISDPKLQDATMERVTRLNSLYLQAKGQAEDISFKQGYEALTDPKNLRGIDGIPSKTLAALPPERQNTLRAYAASMTKREEPATDWGQYYKLQALASSEATRDGFVKTNLLDYRMKLSNTEFKELVKLQSDLREKSGNADASAKVLTGISSREDVVNESLAGLGIDPRPYTVKDGVATVNPPAVAFRRLVDQAVIAQQQATGKPVGPEDVRKISDKLVMQQTVKDPRGFVSNYILHPFGDNFSEKQVPTFQLPGVDRMAFAVSQVPAAEAAKIKEAAARAGRTLTDSEMTDIYNANLKKTATDASK
jgi:hypothetical protein